jgi:hypothetical protein
MDGKRTHATPGRLPYHTPVLRDHGTIEELTLTDIPALSDNWDNPTYPHADTTPPIS